MRLPSRAARVFAAAMLWVAFGASVSGAQAWSYPAFQVPRTTTRELGFAVADGGKPAGESLVFQWREGRGLDNQFSLDIGLANADHDFDADDQYLLVGVQIARQLVRAPLAFPLDILIVGGAFGAMAGGEGNFVRIPIGAVLGRWIELQPATILTPYVHPRLVVDLCGECGDRGSNASNIAAEVDVGLGLNFTRQLALRLAATRRSGGGEMLWDEDLTFGISLSYTPSTVGISGAR